jgi:membrane-associated protease RseP (regulator of RpoE activity)
MRKILMAAFVAVISPGFCFAQDKPDSKPVIVPFELVSSGHFIVKVMLNNTGPYNLIFDTGAPSTLISPRIAEKAKLLNKAKDKPLIPLFGMMGQVKVKDFQVGEVKSAVPVSAQIMDHPTVKLFSDEYKEKYGSIEGIVGFPFFAQYKMTVDYEAKQLTFVPNGYVGGDVMESMQQTLMNAMKSSSSKPQPRIAAPAALWGMELAKKEGDEAEGVDVKAVVAEGAASKSGLKTGDRILTIDGRWTDSLADAYIAVSFVKAGKTVTMVVKREGKEVKLTVTPKMGL